MLGAVKLSISRDGIACGLVWERPEKMAEADVRSAYIHAYSENGQRPEFEMTPDEMDQETARWMESIADFGSMPSN
jgi:hypothetical protein